MKITSQEEYGIRCLLELGRRGDGASLTITEISKAECISTHYVAKLMRVLRRGGLVKSVRGQAGGYRLARPLDRITVSEALAALGGRLYDPAFCDLHVGTEDTCSHTTDCSIRSLWRTVQSAVDQVLGQTTLADLLGSGTRSMPPPAAARLTQIRGADDRLVSSALRQATQNDGLPHCSA